MEPVIMGVGAGVAAIAALIGELVASGREAEAQQVRERIAAQYGPELLAQVDAIQPQTVGGTAFAGVREDEGLRRRQLSAADVMAEMFQSGGQTPADMAALESARNAAASQASSDYQSIAASMARRGMANSGLQTALQAQTGQDTANALAEMGRRSQADARQRAFQALQSSAGLAGGVRGQDYGVSRDRASAVDAMNVFNARAKAQADQQRFSNRMDVLNARGNAMAGQTQGYQQQADNARRLAGGVGNAALDVASVLAEDERKKKGGG